MRTSTLLQTLLAGHSITPLSLPHPAPRLLNAAIFTTGWDRLTTSDAFMDLRAPDGQIPV
jgi:hypothetical protein